MLATDGTIASGVYHAAAGKAPFELIVPSAANHCRVMSAIYGEYGVKAGHLSGACKDDLTACIEELAQRGASTVILGCTELPLLFPSQHALHIGNDTIHLIDPTLTLALRCLELAGYETITPGDALVSQVRELRC